LNWKCHITSRPNKACYAIRSIKPFMSLDVLRSTYFSYVHSIVSYGIIFWGNSSHNDEIFKIQKRIITNSSKNVSSQQLFKQFNILPIQSQYMFSVLLFVTKNKDQFLCNSQVHKNKYKANFQFIPTFSKLGNIPKGCLLLIYNHKPAAIKDLSGDKNTFKLALKILVNETNLVHKLFSVYFVNFVYNHIMFRTSPGPS